MMAFPEKTGKRNCDCVENIIPCFERTCFRQGYLHNFLNLCFIRSAIPGDRLFHFKRSILKGWNSGKGGCQQDGSAGLAYRQSGFGVFGEEEALNCKKRRAILADQSRNLFMYFFQTVCGDFLAYAEKSGVFQMRGRISFKKCVSD